MITSYSQEYKDAMRERFFEKFSADKRPFALKLREIYLPKGTYSNLLNGSVEVSKRTLETMRAYLENRLPTFKALDPETESYCGTCERVLPKAEMRGVWNCKKCQNELNYKSKKRHWDAHLAVCRLRRRKFLIRGPFREQYLLERRRAYLRRQYGKFGPVMELIQNVRKEVRQYENQEV